MKKFISFLLSLALLVSLTVSVFAAEGDQVKMQEDIAAINEVNVAKYAISFVECMYGKTPLAAGNVFSFKSETDKISGYCIDIMDGSNPNGYVIVKFSENKPVVSEYAIEAGVKNPYTSIMEQCNISADNAVFYSVGPNDYQVFNQKEKAIFGTEGLVLAKNEFERYKDQVKLAKKAAISELSSDQNTGYTINYSDLDGWSVVSDSYEGSVQSSTTIPGAGDISYYGSNSVSSIDKTYACSVVALSNLMKYYRSRGFDKISSTFSTLYSDLWNYAGTGSDGSTTNGKEPGAAKEYLKNLGYTCSYTTYWFDYYSDFTRDLNAGKPCLFTYGAKFGDSKGGHAVLAFGYVDTTSYEYLKIADGWNTYLRYINFNGYDYSRKDGWSFSVTK